MVELGDPTMTQCLIGYTDGIILTNWGLDSKDPAVPPGTKYNYSNFGYCILGRGIGGSYESFVQENILRQASWSK